MILTKPLHEKNFFENYSAHITCVYGKLQQNRSNMRNKTIGQNANDVLKGLAARISIFDALRDGHDYFDEIMGGLTVTKLAGLATLGYTALAMLEGALALAAMTGLKKDYNHGKKAADALVVAVAAFTVSVFASLNFALSIYTRPLVTLFSGWKPQNTPRFSYENPQPDGYAIAV